MGRYEFYSGKAERVHSAHKGRCIAHMFAMHVEEELSSWPESPARKRIWVCPFTFVQYCAKAGVTAMHAWEGLQPHRPQPTVLSKGCGGLLDRLAVLRS